MDHKYTHLPFCTGTMHDLTPTLCKKLEKIHVRQTRYLVLPGLSPLADLKPNRRNLPYVTNFGLDAIQRERVVEDRQR